MIYFIRNEETGAVKIGTAGNPMARFRQLKTGSAYRLRLVGYVEGDRGHETALHRRWAHLRMNGEWFRQDDRLDDFIAETLKAKRIAGTRLLRLAEEMKRRSNCREGLVGLTVRNLATGGVSHISATRWGADSRLMVTLDHGGTWTADNLSLCDPWPVTCCRPVEVTP